MACLYCGYSRQVARDRRSLRTDWLIGFGRALKEYKRQTGREILVCWLGGEPYLWPEFWTLTQLFRQQLQLPIGVTTSGVTFDRPEELAKTLRWIDQLTISIDGQAEHHDWARQSPGGWTKLREQVYQLAQMRADFTSLLRANMVLMRGNIDRFAAVCRELASWGLDEISFNQLGGWDRPEFYPANRILPEQWQNFRRSLPDVRRLLADHGVTLAGSDAYLDRLEATTLGNKISIPDCQPGQEFWFIDELGRLSPCSYTSSTYSIPLSELQTAESLTSIPSQLETLRAETLCQACTDCHATHMFDKFASPLRSVR